ncbi:MAG: isoprenylcysteine carboxylmethyltransferase family protein [Proteobacteria bacterium]|nr:isoprenylcysteine carboxylmethyltransferase family protein [Pseudomonadota bacterium]
MAFDPRAAIFAAWIAFLIAWVMVAGWSARAASHDDFGVESPSRVLSIAAIVMMLVAFRPQGLGVIWTMPAWFGWPLFAVVVSGFAFAFWGRLHLGPLWSNAVSPTDAHRIVDTGPYGVVRHPVYAGILLAALATAAELGRVEAVAGAASLIAALSFRAKMEERALRRDVSDADYTKYRARVPMLIPGLRG